MTIGATDDMHAGRGEFRHPPKRFRPMVRWWWPGGDVRAEELRREVGLLDDAGFAGGEIQPFRVGLRRDMPAAALERVNDYRTSAFYERVAAAVEEAASRGIWVDYTLGSGWPFGAGENITPELASRELHFGTRSLVGPARFDGVLPVSPARVSVVAMLSALTGTRRELAPGWDERIEAIHRVVAILAVRGEPAHVEPSEQPRILGTRPPVVKRTGILDHESTTDLSDRLRPDGTLDWEVPNGTWQLFAFYSSVADMRVLGGVGDFPQLVLDHLNASAIASHLAADGDALAARVAPFLGSALRAVFCDSLEVHAELFWSDDFLAQFQRRRGYDLTPFLPVIKVPGANEPFGAYSGPPLYDYADGSLAPRVRFDYWQTVSDLMYERFYRPLIEWAEKHHLQARIQAHGAPADIMRIYGHAHIPETEDLYARGPSGGNEDFYRIATSAGNLHGKRVVAAEAFAFMGQDYRLTPETIKWRSDQFITSGVNQLVFHGFPYEYMDRPEPGWHPFSAPIAFSEHLNHHNPFWEYVPRLNSYLTRLQYIGQQGNTWTPVALYRGDLAYPGVYEEAPINARLLEAGYAFDHINAESLRQCESQGGLLRSNGGATYQVLVLNDQRHIPVAVAERLAAMAQEGLPILFVGAIPEGEIGYFDHDARGQRIRALVSAIQAYPRVAHVKTVDGIGAALEQLARPNLRFDTAVPDIGWIEKRIGTTRCFLFRNGTTEPRAFTVTLPGVIGSPEIWDPWTGNISPLSNFEPEVAGTRVPILLEPYGSQLVVFDPSVQHGPTHQTTVAESPLPPVRVGGAEHPWTLLATGRTTTGQDHIIDRELPLLVNWAQDAELRHFSGKGRYTVTFDLDSAYLADGHRITLDLGDVRDVAEVVVNEVAAGILLLRPYLIDVTSLLGEGENRLQVTVTNSLLNRLIGEGVRTTTVPDGRGPIVEPVASGLLGPVRLVSTVA